jgi:hypothetical protein
VVIFIELFLFVALRYFIGRKFAALGASEPVAIIGSIIVALILLVGWLWVRNRLVATFIATDNDWFRRKR